MHGRTAVAPQCPSVYWVRRYLTRHRTTTSGLPARRRHTRLMTSRQPWWWRSQWRQSLGPRPGVLFLDIHYLWANLYALLLLQSSSGRRGCSLSVSQSIAPPTAQRCSIGWSRRRQLRQICRQCADVKHALNVALHHSLDLYNIIPCPGSTRLHTIVAHARTCSCKTYP